MSVIRRGRARKLPSVARRTVASTRGPAAVPGPGQLAALRVPQLFAGSVAARVGCRQPSRLGTIFFVVASAACAADTPGRTPDTD